MELKYHFLGRSKQPENLFEILVLFEPKFPLWPIALIHETLKCFHRIIIEKTFINNENPKNVYFRHWN